MKKIKMTFALLFIFTIVLFLKLNNIVDGKIENDCSGLKVIGTKDFRYEIGWDEIDYLEGITVTDSCDQLIEANIMIDKSYIKLDTPGDYSLYYFVTSNNKTYETIVVTVSVFEDITEPVINGLAEDFTFIINTTLKSELFTSGVTVTDNKDGDITQLLIVDYSNVDITYPGKYQVIFKVSDSHNNEEIIIKDVYIKDNIPPIVLVEDVEIEVGSEMPNWHNYISVTDNFDIECDIKFNYDGVNLNELGNYTVEVRVSDSSLNETDKTINVTVVDTTAPIITVHNEEVSVFSNELDLESLISITDNYDKNPIIISIEEDIDYNVIGSYEVKVTVKDLSDNVAIKSFYVKVFDDEAPNIIFNIDNPYLIYEIGNTKPNYLLYISSITDNYDQNILLENVIILDNYVNYNYYGIYPVIYIVSDSSGNLTTNKILLFVYDNIPPVINGTKDFILVTSSQKPNYLDGVTASDNLQGDLTKTIQIDDSNIKYDTPGDYKLTYIVWDKVGNVFYKQVNVTILPNSEAPVISGVLDYEIEVFSTLPDFLNGVTATDSLGNQLEVTCDYSNLDLSILNSYIVTYMTKDIRGIETIKTVTVNVVDKTPPKILGTKDITAQKGKNIDILKNIRALDNYDGDLSNKIVIIDDFNTSKTGTYIVKISVSDNSGNETIGTIRITVINNNSPIIIWTSIIGAMAIIGGTTTLFVLRKIKKEQ